VTRTSFYGATLSLSWLEKYNPIINYTGREIFFDSYNCRKEDADTRITEDPEIEEISMAVITRYYEEDPDSVYLAMLIIEGELIVFTLP
jgi:hypothetical protein